MDAHTDNGISLGKNVFLIINQQITPITKVVTRLGRQLENDVVFKEESVSRNHAEIHCENGKYILHDLKSTSGTFVNSRRIERCVLNSGDLISLANVQFMFVNNNPKIANNSAIATRNLTQEHRQKADGK
jgi:pSer/pThr/pTyr-binding forkhead associated (FHA) protein